MGIESNTVILHMDDSLFSESSFHKRTLGVKEQQRPSSSPALVPSADAFGYDTYFKAKEVIIADDCGSEKMIKTAPFDCKKYHISSPRRNSMPIEKRSLPRNEKYVSFSSDNQLESHQDAPETHSAACISELWYNPKDFLRFRCMAQLEASTIKWSPQASVFLALLEQALSIASLLAKEVCKYKKRGHNEAALWDRIFQRLDLEQTGVTQWCCFSDFRGLECFASQSMRHAKLSARRKLKRGLKDQPASSMINSTPKRKSLTSEELAEKFQRRSQQSRLFARMMGIGDEMAALQVYRSHLE